MTEQFTVVTPAPLKVLWGKDAAKPQPMGTIVKGLLHSSSLTMVYGAPKSGKSFLLTSLFLSIADYQRDWMGHRIVRPGPVIYFACEGHCGYWKRLAAAGETPDAFGLCAARPMLIQLSQRSNVAIPHPDEIIATLHDLVNVGQSLPVAIAIDTVFRSFGGGNVNQSDHMNAYISAVTKIMDMGVAVALVHHETKAGGTPAGSVTLTGAADTIISTKNGNGNLHTWEVEAAKDDAQTNPRKFTLDVVEVGVDSDGEPVTSCIMVDHGEDNAPKKKPGRPVKEAERDLYLDLLSEATLEFGEEPPLGTEIPGSVGKVVQVNRWRDLVFKRTKPGESDNAKRSAFKRRVDDLRNQNRIGVSGMWVWRV